MNRSPRVDSLEFMMHVSLRGRLEGERSHLLGVGGGRTLERWPTVMWIAAQFEPLYCFNTEEQTR